jgi:hypothetical protein
MASLNNANQAYSVQDAIPGLTDFLTFWAFCRTEKDGDWVWGFSTKQDLGQGILLNILI